MNLMTWRESAACLGSDPELFFPVGDGDPALAQLAAAQQVCASCPVRWLCLEWAVLHDVDHGVWGGASEAERRDSRQRPRQRRRSATARVSLGAP